MAKKVRWLQGRARIHPLEALRSERGLTVADVSRRSGLPYNTIWRIEQWYHVGRPATLRRIRAAILASQNTPSKR